VEKKRDTWRGDLVRRIADLNAQRNDLKRNLVSGGQYLKKCKELDEKLANLKQQLLR
jgi:ribosomal protein L29